MPDFLTWGIENEKFGAWVQQKPSYISIDVSTQSVIKTPLEPVTRFFDTKKISELANTAKGSKDFWKNLDEAAPKQEALFSNSRDIAEPQVKAATELVLDLINKPAFSI